MKQGYELIENPIRKKARLLVQAFWRKACAHDGIDPKASFVCWSAGNPHDARYQRAMALYLRIAKNPRYYPTPVWYA